MYTPFETEPDFVNDLGVKWWYDEFTTQYAQKPDFWGIKLNAICYYVEEPNGNRTRVLVSDGNIIEEDQNLEALAVKIDCRKFLMR